MARCMVGQGREAGRGRMKGQGPIRGISRERVGGGGGEDRGCGRAWCARGHTHARACTCARVRRGKHM